MGIEILPDLEAACFKEVVHVSVDKRMSMALEESKARAQRLSGDSLMVAPAAFKGAKKAAQARRQI